MPNPRTRRGPQAIRDDFDTRPNSLAATPATKHRPVFHVAFRPEPDVEPTRALRHLLKFALRSCGLRCMSLTEEQAR